MDHVWSPYVLADTTTIEALAAGDPLFIGQLYLGEIERVKGVYAALGDPHLAYESGRGLSQLGAIIPNGHMAVAVFEAQLAELIIAQGGNISGALDHLTICFAHAERAPGDVFTRARILAKATLLRAVVEKAHGADDVARAILSETRNSTWWINEVDPGDAISITRQEVMMTGNLESHTEMLIGAASYRTSRPLEYFRTLKRVFEYFTNHGLTESVRALQPRVIAAYSAAEFGLSPISRVSLIKNLAQSNGLLGDLELAKSLAKVAADGARTLGLIGQQRQLVAISEGLDAGVVVGSLRTFRVSE